MLTDRSEARSWESATWERPHPILLTPAKAALRSVLAQHADAIGLTRATVDAVVARADMKHLRAGRTVYAGGSRGDRVHFLVVGEVQLVCDETIACLIPHGNFLDLPSLLGDQQPRRFGAVTHTPCVVAELSIAAWRVIVASLPADRIGRLAAHACGTLADMAHHRAVLGTLRLRERLEQQLRVLARDFGRPHPLGTAVDLPLTHLQLAKMVGASRANVSRAMKRLAENGWLAMVGRQVVVRGE